MQVGDTSNAWNAGSAGKGYLTAASQGPVVIERVQELGPSLDPNDGQGGVIDFMGLWRVLVRRRVLVLSIAAAAIVTSVAITMLMQPIYTASTTLQIDREAAKILNVEGLIPQEQMVSGDEFFQTQYGLLKSQSLATRVVEKLGLARDPAFLAAADLSDEPDNAQARKAAAVRKVQKNLSVQPVVGSRLVRVSFDSSDPAVAARVANGFADNFISSNLDRRFESSGFARDFLEQRLGQVKRRLEESEKQLVAYAASQQIINVAEESGDAAANSGATQSLTSSTLMALNTSLSVAKTERIRAEQRWRQSQAGAGVGLPEVLQSPTIQALRQQRATLTAQYQEKLGVFKPEFPQMQQMRAQLDEIDRQIAGEIANVRESLRAQYNIAAAQERSLSGQVEGLKASVLDLRSRTIQYNILQREVDTNRQLYDGLLQRYKEVGIAGGVGANNISVVDRAQPPMAPSRPKPLLNVALALVFGVILGVILAFLLEAMDESITAPEDVENKLGLPLLGSVPLLEKGVTPAEALSNIRSAFSEAYHSIRTNLQFATTDGAPRSLLITSARPAEGKSTSAMAIARNFAGLGMRVLLVDGDLRNPSMHRNLEMDNAEGLSNLLTGATTMVDVVQETHYANLSFIACGSLPLNPAELLSSYRLRIFVAQATAEYDLLVIDGPPVMGLADAPILGSVTAGTILVVESQGTPRSLARAALRRLAVGRTRVLGVLLTKFDAKRQAYGASYSYAYDYNYGSRKELDDGRGPAAG